MYTMGRRNVLEAVGTTAQRYSLRQNSLVGISCDHLYTKWAFMYTLMLEYAQSVFQHPVGSKRGDST